MPAPVLYHCRKGRSDATVRASAREQGASVIREQDLVRPVGGIAPLVSQGFRMREIAALLALRTRARCPRRGIAKRPPKYRPCSHLRRTRPAWPKY